MVAITGATGLLGTHIIERLLREGIHPVALCRPGQEGMFPQGVVTRTGDILDQASLQEAFEGITTVIHAAAFVSFNPRLRKKVFEVNVEGTRHVVDTCIQLAIPNLIHISSVAALGRKPGEPITEESKWTGVLASDYGESKYLAELEVYRGAEEGLQVSLVNPSIILSGSQPHRSSAALLDYVWSAKPFYTKGFLNFVDARDVAEAIYRLYLQPRPGEKFILTAGTVSYLDFFSKVSEHFGKRPPHLAVAPALTYWLGWLEEMRGLLFNLEPLVTRQSARLALQNFMYNNSKAQNILGMSFRPLEESLSWCCTDYMRNVKANK
jgi:dihydroflavonol-4-reductase